MSTYNSNVGYGAALLNMVQSVVPTFGRVFIVCSSTDSADPNFQKLQEVCKTDPMGVLRFYTDLAEAYDATTTNNNDVILLDAHSPHVVTEQLTVSKNRVHFIGMDGGDRLVTQGARVYMGVTGVATDLAPIFNQGTRNSFRNLKVENASTTNESLYGFIEGGEGTLIKNCHTLKTAGLNDANHAHFVLASDSATIIDLTCGQSNVPNTAAGFGILIDVITGGQSAVKENFLKNVRVNMSVGGSVQATSSFIKIADTAAMNFANVMEDFAGYNFIPVGGTIMTDAILAPASIVSSTLFMRNPTFMGCTGCIDTGSAGVQQAAGGLDPQDNGGLATNVA